MGYELIAFLGRKPDLAKWRATLPSAVVCPLGGEVSLVPVTAALYGEIRKRLAGLDIERLDRGRNVFPAPSFEEAARRWGREASADSVVAYVSVGEFGNDSHDEAWLWSKGSATLERATVGAVLAHMRDHLGFDLGGQDLEPELGRHRGENAAEKWALEAFDR